MPRYLLPGYLFEIMKTNFHKATLRGHADHGWLESYHTFSFAGYYDPERIHFGALRVLNDDVVEGGKGFGTHPHENMEIISIPLEGDLEHKDDMGNNTIIKEGYVQVMSAGSGVVHSEMNANHDRPVKFLQIWVFPNKKDVAPRYDEIEVLPNAIKNKWSQIVSPNPEDDGVWIHQNAWFYLGEFDRGIETRYILKNKENGVYIFLLDGEIKMGDKVLDKRDGIEITETANIDIKVNEKSKILIMEVPLRW